MQSYSFCWTTPSGREICVPERSKKEDTDINDGQISDMEDNDISDDGVNFVTSTPVKRKVNCKECKNETQCVDCFVRQENPQFSP